MSVSSNHSGYVSVNAVDVVLPSYSVSVNWEFGLKNASRKNVIQIVSYRGVIKGPLIREVSWAANRRKV